MTKNKYLLFIILFVSISVEGQNLDTLFLEEMSSNIPVTGEIEQLILFVDGSQQHHNYWWFNDTYRTYLNDPTEEPVLKKYTVNSIVLNHGSLRYSERKGTFRLREVDFKRYKNADIVIGSLVLSRRLSLAELMKIFNYPDTAMLVPQVGLMAPYKAPRRSRFYQIDFLTGESKNTCISLYFDNKKKLRMMQIDVFFEK